MNRSIEIFEGGLDHLDACITAVRDSQLGLNYFSDDEGRLRGMLREGLAKGEIRIASTADHSCAGFVWFNGNGMFYRHPYIRLLAVNSMHRSNGVGSSLLAYVENLLRRQGHDKVFLTVAEFNSQAKCLYERLGYKEISKVSDLFVAGYVEYVMMKRLPL